MAEPKVATIALKLEKRSVEVRPPVATAGTDGRAPLNPKGWPEGGSVAAVFSTMFDMVIRRAAVAGWLSGPASAITFPAVAIIVAAAAGVMNFAADRDASAETLRFVARGPHRLLMLVLFEVEAKALTAPPKKAAARDTSEGGLDVATA
jgi:hypothetical protein